MRKKIVAIGIGLATLAGSVLLASAQPASAASGLHVVGTDIVEADGQVFVMRGVNHPHAWFASQTGSLADIKALGANTVRVVLSGGRWTTNTPSDVANVISLCKQNKLICVLEDHDTTGYGEDGAAYTLDQAVDYWISLKDVLVGQENYIAINIGNEPIGNNDAGQWISATTSAVQRMRSAGFQHLLVIDAPNWGQDWTYVMRDNAQTILDADPQQNTVLSIHMYDVFNTASSIAAYLDEFEANGWPLIIGEFGWQRSSNNVDDQAVLAQAQARGMGYLGWSWSGNNDPYLDMTVGFDANQLTTWGERIFNGANGITATSREASIYGGGTPSPTATTTSPSPSPTTTTASPSPTTTSPSPTTTTTSPSPTTTTTTATPTTTTPAPSSDCTATYSVVSQWPNGYLGDVRVTAGSTSLSGWTVTWTFADGQTVTQYWNASVTSSGSRVSATNLSYNGSVQAGSSVSFGFIGTWSGTNSVPTDVTCTAS